MSTLPVTRLLVALAALTAGCGSRTAPFDVYDGLVDATPPRADAERDGALDASDEGVDAIAPEEGVDAIGPDEGLDAGSFDSGVDGGLADVVVEDTGYDTGADTGADTGYDAGPDAGAEAGVIRCGATNCDASYQTCCVSTSGATCLPAGVPCGGGLTLSCSSASSCSAGEVCCASQSLSGGFSADCQSACTSGIQMCATRAECPLGQRCRRVPSGYGICR